MGSFSASIPQSFALSPNLPITNSRAIWLRFGAFPSPLAPFPEIHRPLTTIFSPFAVSKHTRRAPPFRLGGARVCVSHRIVKDHPHDPDILSLRHKGLAGHSRLGKTRDLRYL